ncbi:hypothetical protein HPB52_023791 [Rhipicephalus sanguineus]|uniref:Uncharacterized protein n=1 Tax=Rhipicephalus sanguineus TaxID=34632 RepID=A0A9D4Q3S4_RHISA|nr:hypothetical protein HPB52_023791 [Rhipicephalus sanguineus]
MSSWPRQHNICSYTPADRGVVRVESPSRSHAGEVRYLGRLCSCTLLLRGLTLHENNTHRDAVLVYRLPNHVPPAAIDNTWLLKMSSTLQPRPLERERGHLDTCALTSRFRGRLPLCVQGYASGPSTMEQRTRALRVHATSPTSRVTRPNLAPPFPQRLRLRTTGLTPMNLKSPVTQAARALVIFKNVLQVSSQPFSTRSFGVRILKVPGLPRSWCIGRKRRFFVIFGLGTGHIGSPHGGSHPPGADSPAVEGVSDTPRSRFSDGVAVSWQGYQRRTCWEPREACRGSPPTGTTQNTEGRNIPATDSNQDDDAQSSVSGTTGCGNPWCGLVVGLPRAPDSHFSHSCRGPCRRAARLVPVVEPSPSVTARRHNSSH